MKGHLERSSVQNTTLWKLVGFGAGVVYGLLGTYEPMGIAVPFSLLASLLCATLLGLGIIFWRNDTTLLIIRWGAKTAMILLVLAASIGFLLGQMLYSYDPAAAGPGNAALSSGLPLQITIATGLLIIVGIGVSFFREWIGGILLLLGAGMMQLFFTSIPELDYINPYDVSIALLGVALLYCGWYRWSRSKLAQNASRR